MKNLQNNKLSLEATNKIKGGVDGKGMRYSDEFIRRKAGKAAAK